MFQLLVVFPPPQEVCAMPKKDEKKPEDCPVDLTPVEEAAVNATPDSGGGDNGSNPPKPGGK